MLEINPILNSVMDGIHGGNVENIEEDMHFFNIFANSPQMNQIINISEAALINYFKPKYNNNFKENFPNKIIKAMGNILNWIIITLWLRWI